MNKVEIINRLKNAGHITYEESEILFNNDERLKHFQIWKAWKHDESILLNNEEIEKLKRL